MDEQLSDKGMVSKGKGVGPYKSSIMVPVDMVSIKKITYGV